MTMLQAAVLLFVLMLPPGLAALLASRRLRPVALALAPWAALPALLVAVAGWPAVTLKIDWILLGAAFGIDEASRSFLLLTAAVWLAGGLAAGAYHRRDPGRVRLFAFHLVTFTGNLGLVLARDALSFYLFFMIMSFAAFGLIVHTATPEARRAGFVYIVLIIVGEALLLPGLWIAVAGAASLSLADVAANVADKGAVTILLLAAGFGVKAGVLPLHVWLPLAHPVAPTPASAVLSGAMITAGVIGWISFLPLGLGSQSGFASIFIVGGFAAALYGAAVGTMQQKAKTVLAYSSISQMGFLTAAVGFGLSRAEVWPLAAAAIAVYALHHSLAKGALFLGVGVVENARDARSRRLALALLLLPSLALAGVPLTSGFIAKSVFKEAAHQLPAAWHGPLDLLLAVGAFATTVVLARFLYVLAQMESHAGRPGLWPSWLSLLGASALLGLVPGALPLLSGVAGAAPEAGSAAWSSSLWPPGLAIAVAAGAIWLQRQRQRAGGRRLRLRLPVVPEGDILWLLVRAGRALRHALPSPPAGMIERLRSQVAGRRRTILRAGLGRLQRAEGALVSWPGVGSGVLIAVLVIFLLLAAA